MPAEFFVHRHVRGKWACRCCQILVQEPVGPKIIDKGLPAAGLIARTMVSRFVDHIPYYRQATSNARSQVHTPRSSLASRSGAGGASLQSVLEVHRDFVLDCAIVHADETSVSMLDPGTGKTKKAYIWAYALGAFDALPGVAYDICVGRGAQCPSPSLATGQARWCATNTRAQSAALT